MLLISRVKSDAFALFSLIICRDCFESDKTKANSENFFLKYRDSEREFDCFENKSIVYLDFDIPNDRIDEHWVADKRIDNLSKHLDTNMRKEKNSIEEDILNNSAFDESFEIDFWVFALSFENESFFVKYR